MKRGIRYLIYSTILGGALILLYPSPTYSGGITSRGVKTKQDREYNPERRTPVSREKTKNLLKKIMEYSSPDRGEVINPVIEGVDKGIKRGNLPGTSGTTWNQKRNRMQKK